jgi:hypothetical protein
MQARKVALQNPESLARLKDFISEHHPWTWPTGHLRCADLAIEYVHKGEVAAVLWFTWVTTNDTARVSEMHGCCKPEYKGRWLTKGTLFDTFRWAHEVCDVVLTIHDDEDLRGMLHRVGFDQYGDFLNVLDMRAAKWAS